MESEIKSKLESSIHQENYENIIFNFKLKNQDLDVMLFNKVHKIVY